jgi:hypothetical protein
MKNIPTFEGFLNEAKAERATINASLWKGQTPEIKKEPNGNQYRFYSGEVFGNVNAVNFLDRPNIVLIVIEEFRDKLFIKTGYGSEDDRGDKRYIGSVGDNIVTNAEELKSDPKGMAKKVADMFISNKKALDMNFEPYGNRAIFKIEKDIEKPALELIEFALKSIK